MKRKWKVVLVAVLLILVAGFLVYKKTSSKTTTQAASQTAIVERGNMVVSISASGQVSTANSAQVTTEASGVVTTIYVQNGQKVNSGDPIAQLQLDMEGQQRNFQALASYQSSQNNLHSLRSTMLTKWQSYMDKAPNATTEEKTSAKFIATGDDWLAAEAAFKNQQNTIIQNYLAYLQTSPTIYAPISGTITGLGLQVGSVITAQSNSSGGSSAQKIASVVTQATPTITINLTEIDAPKVKIGQKATITLDAFSDKTFTGEVISVDTVGSISSGVTTYPAVIKLDTNPPEILTNMSAQAKIITQVKNDVLIIPTSAITNGVVRVVKNGQISMVNVETGLVSGTQTEIISGLSQGNVVQINSAATTQRGSQTQSVFGSFGGGSGVRVIGR